MTQRPKYFDDIIGQEKVKEALLIAIKSAKARKDAMGHTLIDAPPGLGKTTFSIAIGNELGVKIKQVLGGNIKSFKDILPTITNMKENEVLFIDEIHRLSKKTTESLYTVLEDFRIDLPSENEKGEKEILSIDLPKFTVIGATTEVGKLPQPFRDRFKLKFSLELYDIISIAKIIKYNCNNLPISMTDEAIIRLAKASRGTPRIANALLEWVRDYSIAKCLSSVTADDLKASLEMRGIGMDGSTENDRRYVRLLKKVGKPVGISTLESALNIDRETIESVIEPFLLRLNIICKSSKGRMAL
ncbi:MAG: Holliday junction branch migration DNA helicase RuvB [Candidatus Lokiarchaeota archaeon]|nr:Holliday junction branch migration DNA helicase RuvB [Candidatus Lokiarchaeota archaeon]